MSAEDSTPCQEAPEAWVGDNDRLRAEAAKECATCPLHMFAACQKLATVEPFGVMAGRDYGVRIKVRQRPDRQPTFIAPEDVKECETCHATIHRGNRSRFDWAKLRFCSRTCYGVTLAVPGLPDEKVCERCGVVFPRDGRAPAHWRKARFCGVVCGNAKTPKEKAA